MADQSADQQQSPAKQKPDDQAEQVDEQQASSVKIELFPDSKRDDVGTTPLMMQRNELIKRTDLTLQWLGMVQYTQVQHARMMSAIDEAGQCSKTPASGSHRLTPTCEGDSPFDIILTPEAKNKSTESKSSGGFMTEHARRIEQFAKDVISKFKKEKGQGGVKWIEYEQFKDSAEDIDCYQELQKLVAKTVAQSLPQGCTQDLTINKLLLQLGWVLTQIKAEVTEQQDRLLDASEKMQGTNEKEENITVNELIELACSITLDHYSHVYMEQFESIKTCFSVIVEDIKEQVLSDKQVVYSRLDAGKDLNLEKGEQMLSELLNSPLHDFKGTIETQFRIQMGIELKVKVPDALVKESEQQLKSVLEAEYTQILLDVLAQKGAQVPDSVKQEAKEQEFNELRQAFERITSEPDGILGSQYFQENFPQFIMALYCANLPCSANKYTAMNQLRDRALNILSEAARGKAWESSQTLLLQGFSTSIYGLCEVSSIDLMKQTVKDTLVASLSRQQLLELLIWFYLAAADLVTYSSDKQKLEFKFTKSVAIERDAILNLTLLVFGQENKALLPRLEQLYSKQMTKVFAERGLKDPRLPLYQDTMDVANVLESMTCPGERIIDELYERLKPDYDGFLPDEQSRRDQLSLAKRAIFKAHELLLFHKRDNQGQLPIATLKNLLPEEPNTNSRHITIAISGWLSQESDVQQQWVDLIDHFKDSGSGLFAFNWESQKAWSLAQGLGDQGINVSKRYVKSSTLRMVGKSHKLSQVLRNRGKLAKVIRISPLDLVMAGIDLTMVFSDSFKAGKKHAKVAGQLLACTLAMRRPFMTQSISLIGFSLGTQVIKSCLKTLYRLGATDLIQNVTFMGGAIDRLDREKTCELWATILSSCVPGQINNVYTKKDLILILYSICEVDQSVGRNVIFSEAHLGDKRTNLLVQDDQSQSLPAVAAETDLAFSLKNCNIWALESSAFLGIGHCQYREYLSLILDYIQLRI